MGPSSGSRVQKNPVVGSNQFRRVAWNSNEGGLRSSKWVTRSQREHVVGPSSGLRVQKDHVVGSDQFRRVAGNSN